MRIRNCRFEVRFTEGELSELTQKARMARMSKGGFLRKAINNTTFTPAPPADFYGLMREVKRVGSNIDQLLKVAYTKGFIDVPALRTALDEWSATEKMLWDTFRPTVK